MFVSILCVHCPESNSNFICFRIDHTADHAVNIPDSRLGDCELKTSWATEWGELSEDKANKSTKAPRQTPNRDKKKIDSIHTLIYEPVSENIHVVSWIILLLSEMTCSG